MPKQLLEVTDFSGGLNCYSDARDIKDNQFEQNWNAIVDKAGIIRVAGMATKHIRTDLHLSTNMQEGFGLFQFTSDYSINSLDADFNSGIKSGTLSAGATGPTSAATLETTYAGSLNEFSRMMIFIYDGTGNGQSRMIASSTAATPPVLTLNDAFDIAPDSTSKYMIYRWKTDGVNWAGKDAVNREDFITNGYNANMLVNTIKTYSENNYYIFSKRTSITDNESSNLGYIEYSSSLTLKPGVKYNLSFDCAAKDKWYNMVSDGVEAGISNITITTDNTGGTVSATTSSVTIDVDNGGSGSIGADLAAMQALILNREVYKSDGTFIGRCTAVAYTSASDGTVTFGGGIKVDVANNTVLYVGGFGDKVPWVQLYSTTAAESVGSIKTLANQIANTVAVFFNVDNFEEDESYFGVEPYKQTGTGNGAVFTLVTNGSGDVYLLMTSQRGTGYAAGDVLVFQDPGSTSNTISATISAIDIVGATLQANGNWLSGSVQSNYLKKVDTNYVDNGDFQDGVSSEWTKTGSGIDLSESTAYDGAHGTCKMIPNTSMSFTNGDPVTYISQELTLDESTYYHLNFLYDSPEGIYYAVEDTLNSNDIIPWTKLEGTRLPTESAKFKYAGAKYNTRYSDVENNYTMNYITFLTPDASSTSDLTVKIKFSTLNGSSEASLHGITVYKSHNDLVTMSYNDYASNPFSNSIKNFNTYTMRFTLPSNYSEVDDWVLRFHAGQYGFRTGNTLDASNTQEVYFDNIRLSSEEGDTLTLLTDNTNVSSNIGLHSKLSGVWTKDMIKWGGLNSKPVYNYVNGMLKISDGNFNNANKNKVMCHLDGYGWQVKDYSIPTPPAILARDIAFGEFDSSFYSPINTINYDDNGDALDNGFLNEYFKLQTFAGYNWLMSQFGSRPSTEHGLMVRYHHGEGDVDDGGNKAESGDLAGNIVQYYDILSDFYKYHIEQGHTIEGYEDQPGDHTDNITVGGYKTSVSAPYNINNAIPGNIEDSGSNKDKARNPFYFVVKGVDAENGLGMDDVQPSSSGNIRKVSMRVRYVMQGFGIGYYSLGHNDHYHPPFFEVSIGKLNVDEIPDVKAVLINGGDINVGYDVLGWQGFQPNKYKTLEVGTDTSYIEEEDGKKSWFQLALDDLWVENYKGGDADAKVENFHISPTAQANADPIRGEIEFTIDTELKDFEIKRTDDLLFKIKILYSQQALAYDTRNLFSRYAGFGGYGVPTKSSANSSGIYNEGNYSYGNENMSKSSCYERFEIPDIKIHFENEEINPEETFNFIGSGKETQVNFTWDEPQGATSTGWGDRKFRIGVSCENIFGEESSINTSSSIIGENDEGESSINVGYAPEVKLIIGNSHFQDNFISKTKYYMKDTESDIWYLQFYVDHKTEQLSSTTSGISASGDFDVGTSTTTWIMGRNNLKNFNEVNSYESETFISQDDATTNLDLTCRYKASVVANNRLYVGNIYQNGRIYGDRMIKSPIGKYNLLPKSNFIDVEINDGDDITALAYYKDKILQFKKRKVFVISTSGDYEFLEDTFENIGVVHQTSVCTTPHGIVWVNKSGCHVYDGEKVKNLVEKVIPVISDYSAIANNYWKVGYSLYNNNPSVAYSEIEDSILVKWTISLVGEGSDPAGATYNFTTNSWCFVNRAFSGSTTDIENFKISNMITDENGDILFYRFGPVLTGPPDSANSIKKWNHAPLVIDHSGSGIKVIAFKTKDFTFGNIATRKKLYKVYITYKTNSDSGVEVTGAVNGTKSFSVAFSTSSKFQNTTTACYAGTTLDSTGNVWKTAELKFATPSQVNNINSFQLSLAAGQVPADFEINDISISYKVKRVK